MLWSVMIKVSSVLLSFIEFCPTNENGLKLIEMDSDFQKYWFTNVKINAFQFRMPHFLFIYRNCMKHISMPFSLKIILAFSVHNTHIVNTVQFKIVNKKCNFSIQLHPIESNLIQLNPIKSKKSIHYLKHTFG